MGMVIEDGETSKVIVCPIGVDFFVIEFVPMDGLSAECWKVNEGITGCACGETRVWLKRNNEMLRRMQIEQEFTFAYVPLFPAFSIFFKTSMVGTKVQVELS